MIDVEFTTVTNKDTLNPLTAASSPTKAGISAHDFLCDSGMLAIKPSGCFSSTVVLWWARLRHLTSSGAFETVPPVDVSIALRIVPTIIK